MPASLRTGRSCTARKAPLAVLPALAAMDRALQQGFGVPDFAVFAWPPHQARAGDDRVSAPATSGSRPDSGSLWQALQESKEQSPVAAAR